MRRRFMELATLGLTAFLYAVVAAGAIGRTAGVADVSASGAATYAISIWTPPGTHGMQPKLTLNYDSRAGNGLLGVGWSVSGFSEIARCRQNYAQDISHTSISLTFDDRFCLNGNRLRSISGAYGATGSTYQTEIADFSTITANGVQGNGPASFTVVDRNGWMYEYGATNDSRVIVPGTTTPRVWALNKVTDRNGNYITYTYHYDTVTGSYRPYMIQYTGNAGQGLTPAYSITFTYELRDSTDAISSYVAGANIRETNRLALIEVAYAGTNVVRRYDFSYDPDSNRTRLFAILQCSDTDCLQGTTFSWHQTGWMGWSSSATTVSANATADKIITLDLNGDGLPDLLYSEAPSYSSACFNLGILDGGFGPKTCTSLPILYPPTTADRWGQLARAVFSRVMDSNGDGRQEFLQYNPTASSWQLLSLNASDALQVTTLGFSEGSSTGEDGQYATVADVNGDGRDDFVYSRNGADGGVVFENYGIYVRLSTGSGFGAPTQAYIGLRRDTSTNSFYATKICRGFINVGDVNGDGVADLAALTVEANTGVSPGLPYCAGLGNGQWTLFTSYRGSFTGDWTNPRTISGDLYARSVLVGTNTPPIIADFNGDGLSDFAYPQSGGSWGLRFGTGSSAAPLTAVVSTGVSPTDFAHIFAADYNHDQRSDLIYAQSGSWQVAVSNGDGTFISGLSTGISSAALAFGADMNGDALSDFVSILTGPQRIEVRPHLGLVADLLQSVTDGFGNYVYFNYRPLTRPEVHTADSTAMYPERDFRGSLYVVSGTTSSDGQWSSITKNYSYAGARLNVQGRGFLGFRARTVSDSRDFSRRVEQYERAFPMTGMPRQDDLYQPNGTTLVSHSVLTPTFVTLDATANNQRYFIRLSNTLTESYEVVGTKNGQLVTTRSTSYSYDGSGNVTSVATTTTDNDASSPSFGQQWTSTTSRTITPQPGCLGLPTQESVTNTAPGQSAITRTVSYVPDYSHCRMTQEVVEPDSATYRVTRDLLYDAFGNVRSESLTGAGMPMRTTLTYWGTTGQFPEAVTNPLGQVTLREYDKSKGVLTKLTDPNLIVTQWGYDMLARKTRETRADGTVTTWTYNSCGLTCNTLLNKMTIVETTFNVDGTTQTDANIYVDRLDRISTISQRLFDGTYDRRTVEYDSFGRVLRYSAPCRFTACNGLYWTTFDYDLLGRVQSEMRPTSATDPTPVVTLYSYAGQTITVTDPLGTISTKVMTPLGTLARSQDHAGYAQNFTYDAFGSLLSVTDSASVSLFSATYDYGIEPFQRSSTDADRGTRLFTYDALGEITQWSDAKGQNFSATYDALSRLTSKTMPEGTGSITAIWTWGTSAANRNIGSLEWQQIAGTGLTSYRETYTYDQQGRLTRTRYTVDSSNYDIDTAYDANTGLMDSLTYPNNGGYRLKLKYGYANRTLLKVSDFNDPSRTFWQVDATDARGIPTLETLGNGLRTSRSFDTVTGLPEYIRSGPGGGSALQNLSYLWNAVGNLTQRQDGNQGLTENFYYDNLHRLDWSSRNGTMNLDLAYAPNGNIETKNAPGVYTHSYSYHASRIHQVTSINTGSGTRSYSYDNNGNMMSRSGTSVDWFADELPKTITDYTTGNRSQFQYTPTGSRWRHEYQTNSAGYPQVYGYINIGDVVETTGLGWKYLIYVAGRPVAFIFRNGFTSSNTYYYLLKDHLGSTDVITDAAGAVYVRESFDAFGKRRGGNWMGNPTTAEINAIQDTTRRGFTSHEHLDSTDLIHANGRVYDPLLGRFLSADPYVTELGNTQNFNRYSYVDNNPLSFTDPSGFAKTEVCVEIGGQRSCSSFELGINDYNARFAVPWVCFGCEFEGILRTRSSMDFDAINAQLANAVRATGSFLYPNVADMGARGVEGSWGDVTIGFLKAGYNLASSLEVLLNPTSRLWGGGQQLQISDQELGGAAGFEVLTAIGGIAVSLESAATRGAERIFYRIITQPAGETFWSNAAKGLAPRAAELKNPALHRGISVFDTLEGAHARVPILERGGHEVLGISELRVPAGATNVTATKTLGPGHYTMHGSPEVIESLWFFSWFR